MKEFKNVKILDFDVPTRTGKIYTKECILNALDDELLKEKLNTGSMFGFLESSNTGVEDVAFSVTSLKVENNSLDADIKLLNTPKGKIAETLLRFGMPLTLGLRGQGTMNDNTVENIDIDSVDLLSTESSNNVVGLSPKDRSDFDINKSLYNIENRKQYVYDDDIATLFYKGYKVAKGTCETFRHNWCEEMSNCKDMNDFLEDIGVRLIEELDDEDIHDNWENIWDNLEWNEESKSYKYKNWEWIVLDI